MLRKRMVKISDDIGKNPFQQEITQTASSKAKRSVP